MQRPLRSAALLLGLPLACVTPAFADELRDFCPDRPGLGTPACIVDRGHVVIEGGFADWTREKDGSTRTDTVMSGNVLVRYGLTETLEVQAGWDGFGWVRTLDRAAGVSERDNGQGDTSLALRQSLLNPDGSGFSVAVMPYIGAPTGSTPLSAGDWGGGVIVPIGLDLGSGLSLGLSPEVDAAVDGDGHGRHLAYGSVVGLGISLSDTVSAALETSLFRDQDPDGHSTITLASLALAWQPMENLQLDLGVVAGLNSDSPDAEVYGGIARRF